MDQTAPADTIIPVIIATLILLITLVAYISSLVWLCRDANRRNCNGILITILVAVFAWPIGLLIWILARPRR